MKQTSILTKILVPLVGIFVIIGILLGSYIYSLLKENTIVTSVSNAKETINQFKILRGYYTKNVVSKVKAQGVLKIAVDHWEQDDAIPLPATMIHDLSALLKEKGAGTQLKLYSALPFPNRKDRNLDNFGEEAWQYFQKEPEGSMVRVEEVDGQQVIRVAVADKMVSGACVSCHNSHPETPKNDWRLNDVRGVLEVITPIENQLQKSQRSAIVAFLIIVVVGILTIVFLGFVILRSLNPLKQAVGISQQFKDGFLDIQFNTDVKDETGELLSSLQKVVESIKSIIHKVTGSAIEITNTSESLAHSSQQMNANVEGIKNEIILAANSSENVKTNVTTIAAAAEQAASNVSSVSVLIGQLSSNFTTVAAATEQASVNMSGINQNVNQISSDIQRVVESTEKVSTGLARTAEHTRKASNISQEANVGTQQMSTVMEQLGDSASQVARAVKLIDSIASQTNMLALNATIEAASAGAAGKGFGVVAGEVKALALQTASANSEIGKQIETILGFITKSQQQAMEVNKIITQVGTINVTINREMEEQQVLASQISLSVETIAGTTQESALNVEEATLGLKEITRSIASASQAARESNITSMEAVSGVREVAKSAMQVSLNINGVNENVQQVRSSIEEISREISKTSQEAQNLSSQASVLKGSIGFFKLNAPKAD